MGKEEKVFEKYSKGAVDQELKTLAGYWKIT